MKYTTVDECYGHKMTQIYEGTPEEIAELQEKIEVRGIVSEMEADMVDGYLGEEDG